MSYFCPQFYREKISAIRCLKYFEKPFSKCLKMPVNTAIEGFTAQYVPDSLHRCSLKEKY